MSSVPECDATTTPDAEALEAGQRNRSRPRPQLDPDMVVAAVGWVLVALFTALTVGVDFSDRTFIGTDYLSLVSPWRTDLGDITTVTNPGIGDTIDQAAPSAILMSEEMRQGRFAQWDPYVSGGVLLGAVPTSAILNPLSLPWLVLPHSWAPGAVKVLEIAAAGLGMHLLLRRRLGLARAAAPMATLVFVSSGFMVAWTNWPQTRVAALIPLLFWAVDRLATNRRRTDIAPAAIVLASMLLGGFPAIVVYSFYLALPYFACRLWMTRPSLRQVAGALTRSALSTVLALGLAAIQLLPFALFSKTHVPWESRDYTGSALPTNVIASFLTPNVFNSPAFDSPRWPGHFVEEMSYLGAAALVLIAAALVLVPSRSKHAPVSAFFGAAFILLVAAVYWHGPVNEALTSLPGISTSLSGRMRSVIGFSGAVLAGIGLSTLTNPRPSLRAVWTRPWWSLALRLAGATVILVVPVWWLRKESAAALNEGLLPEPSGTTVFLSLSACMIVVALVVRANWIRAVAPLGLLVLVLVPAVNIARTWWPSSVSESFYPVTATHEYLSENLGSNRVAAAESAMLGSAVSVYRVRSLGGHAFASPEWRQLAETIALPDRLGPTNLVFTLESLLDQDSSNIMDRLGVTHLVVPYLTDLPFADPEFQESSSSVDLSTTVARTATFDGPTRGISFLVLGHQGLPEHGGLLTARLLVEDQPGEWTQWDTVSVFIYGIAQVNDLPLDGESIPEGAAWTVELAFEDTAGSLIVATDAEGLVEASPISLSASDLDVVATDDATVFERPEALDRIRWASDQLVVEDPTERIEVLGSPDLPDTTVVLNVVPSQVGAVAEVASTATVTELPSDTDNVVIDVDATGAGWVVVADALTRGGWRAMVDGVEAELVPAEHACGAVFIPSAGTHRVHLTFTAPGFDTGRILSCVSLLVLLALGGSALCGLIRGGISGGRRLGRP